MTDPSSAIGLAVTQINAGKLDEAGKLLTSIIDDTDKKAPNLGAHVARGTARALQRELQGTDTSCWCHAHVSVCPLFVLQCWSQAALPTYLSKLMNHYHLSYLAGFFAFGGICGPTW